MFIFLKHVFLTFLVCTKDLGVSLLIGNPDAGDLAKTGGRQGVRPDRRVVEQLLLRYRREAISAGPKRVHINVVGDKIANLRWKSGK